MSTVFVTGGTGLTGANVCEQLIGRGDAVKALEHRVEDLDHRTAPQEVLDMFGPTLYAIAEAEAEAEAAADADRPPRTAANPTHDQLGYDPMSLDEGLGLLIPWLRDIGRV
ncbi:MAG: NAD-dependent epimerase/dehydratase family protein [Acidimicrobiales bacterium]